MNSRHDRRAAGRRVARARDRRAAARPPSAPPVRNRPGAHPERGAINPGRGPRRTGRPAERVFAPSPGDRPRLWRTRAPKFDRDPRSRRERKGNGSRIGPIPAGLARDESINPAWAGPRYMPAGWRLGQAARHLFLALIEMMRRSRRSRWTGADNDGVSLSFDGVDRTWKFNASDSVCCIESRFAFVP